MANYQVIIAGKSHKATNASSPLDAVLMVLDRLKLRYRDTDFRVKPIGDNNGNRG